MNKAFDILRWLETKTKLGSVFNKTASKKEKRLIDLKDRLSIVVPTINSASYIDVILKYYIDLGIPVYVFVDSKTHDGTFDIAKKYAHAAIMNNSKHAIEEDTMPWVGAMQQFSQGSSAEWILRIDDDELPSEGLISFIADHVDNYEIEVVGFRRFQCAISKNGTLLYSKQVSATGHRQFRLFRPSKVHFVVNAIHSPGYDLSKSKTYNAPDDAFLIHLDWAVHSYAERLQKIERYDQHTPEAGTYWRSFYLYEEANALHPHSFAPLGASEFSSVGKEIATRFSELCVDNSYSRPEIFQKVCDIVRTQGASGLARRSIAYAYRRVLAPSRRKNLT
jgi:glycosyltransferase involved in cell wall biosynthesis